MPGFLFAFINFFGVYIRQTVVSLPIMHLQNVQLLIGIIIGLFT